MDRLKQARASSGGRIEGISRVQSTGGSWWRKLFSGGSGREVDEAEGSEEDEGLVWGGRGPFTWAGVEGVEITWGASALGGLKAAGEDGEGLVDIKDWLIDV